jgi:hypothetical protein
MERGLEVGVQLARLGLGALVVYVVFRVAKHVAVWLGNSRPVQYGVYVLAFLFVGALLMGVADGAASSIFGVTVSGSLMDALVALLQAGGST